jgi:hypothetical protein
VGDVILPAEYEKSDQVEERRREMMENQGGAMVLVA